MQKPIRIRTETLLLALDYLQFLASIMSYEDREVGLVHCLIGTIGTKRSVRAAVVAENPQSFATEAESIDGVMSGRCGCPVGIEEYDWAPYYEQSIWKPFREAFLAPNREVGALLSAEVDVAPILDASQADIEQPLSPSDTFEEEAGIFGRFLALLSAGEIVERDLMEHGG